MKSTRETRKEQMAALQNKKGHGEKAENATRVPRAAFGDLTNAVKNVAPGKKEAVVGKKGRQSVEAKIKAPAPRTRTTVVAPPSQAPIKTRRAAAAAAPTTTTATTTTTTKTKITSKAAANVVKTGAVKAAKKETKKVAVVEEPEMISEESEVTSSQESEVTSSQESEVTSSQEFGTGHDLSDMVVSDLELSFSDISVEDRHHSRMSLDRSIQESDISNKEVMPEVPDHIEDIDGADQDDISQVALYARDVFLYYKAREAKFRVAPYMARQPQVTQRMRAVLVDWMVEVQENFELNHETLYLAVKLVDAYLAVSPAIQRDIVQLLGAVALFLSSKYDERMPPAIDDFIYICDHAYDRDQFTAMERELFSAVKFDLGRPIQYRFLRRYAKCGRSETKTLYLARYLLELGLMEYKFVFQSESLLAASVLYIAKKMRHDGDWTPTLEFYTGHTLTQLKPLVLEINHQFLNARFPELRTIKEKYKHQVFLQVADIPPVSNDELFPPEKEAEEPQH